MVVAFMTLHDMNDMEGAMREAIRVLKPGGRICIAVVHPINSAGIFAGPEPDAPFTITGSYTEAHGYFDEVERNGLPMTFKSRHRPLQAYCDLLTNAGLLIEAVREVGGEPGQWQRLPLFLHLRARLTEL
jgi:ubiquinone/menaquinone biosynthesis C-methylase UbiE